MLKQLSIKKLTVFKQADFKFSSGLNILIGENGTGKSHVLKLIYAIIAENNSKLRKKDYDLSLGSDFSLPKIPVQYVDKLVRVFCADSIKSLIRIESDIRFSASASFYFKNSKCDCSFTYRRSEEITQFYPSAPEHWESVTAAFMPTRELLTIYPNFASLYEARYLEFEETYYDTCLLLGEPLLKKPMIDLLEKLENAIGGKTELEHGRFYLVTANENKIEMPMVAEGIRKLAMLAQLIAVGALKKGGYLFWDEPEANLNPRLIKTIAMAIHELAKSGIQVFIATHSLFLLRELEILRLAEKKPISQRYFALNNTVEGVELEQGDSLEDLSTLVLLDEELLQSDRYMALE